MPRVWRKTTWTNIKYQKHTLHFIVPEKGNLRCAEMCLWSLTIVLLELIVWTGKHKVWRENDNGFSSVWWRLHGKNLIWEPAADCWGARGKSHRWRAAGMVMWLPPVNLWSLLTCCRWFWANWPTSYTWRDWKKTRFLWFLMKYLDANHCWPLDFSLHLHDIFRNKCHCCSKLLFVYNVEKSDFFFSPKDIRYYALKLANDGKQSLSLLAQN